MRNKSPVAGSGVTGPETTLINTEACMDIGAAYSLPNGMPFCLVADLDSFLFETRSAYELMVKFIWMFLRDLGSPKASLKAHQLHGVIGAEIAVRNGETAWIEALRSNRHLFIHETAAWPALQVVSLEPFDVELVLLQYQCRKRGEPLKDDGFYLSRRGRARGKD